MNSMARKALVVTALIFACVGLFLQEARAEKKIGVLLWSDESRYGDSRDGILEQMKKEGFAGPKVTFTTENAGGNKGKAAEISQKWSTAKFDMVIAVGTSAAVAAAKEIKTVPVIFTMVYDPVDSKIAESWKSSGNNTTGASPKVPMDQLVNNLKKFASVKNLAVLYTPGEKNSEAQLKELQALQGSTHIKIIPVPLTRKEEVASVMSEVVNRANAVYLSGSSIVGDSLSTIVDIATKAKVVTVTHLQDHAEKGVLLGVSADPRSVGQLAGTKAVKVLKGAKPASVPIETVKKFDLIINMKTAKQGPIDVPASLLKEATKVIQ